MWYLKLPAMNKRCLYCYQHLNGTGDFHEKCSMAFFGTKTPPVLEYTLGQMAKLAKDVVERSVAIPGVQPKLSLTIINESLNNGRRGRLTIVDALGGNYILKPPTAMFHEMPENEHVTMRIAEHIFGIKTVSSSLIRLASGELSFITKRIDRTRSGEKIHMLDMFQITEAFDKYKSSMERIGKAIAAYSANTLLDQLSYFEIALFSFITGNSDMHLKNFSLIPTNGQWGLAPAYDLLNVHIVLPEDTEELALPIDGKKLKLKRSHFEQFGLGLGLSERQIGNVFKRFRNVKDSTFAWLDRSFLSEEMKTAYKAVFNERMETLLDK